MALDSLDFTSAPSQSPAPTNGANTGIKKKQIAIGDLKLGMYVIELDRPWLGTPFDFQGFPLTSQDQIDKLRQYCQIVYVDPDREPWTPERRKAALGLRGSAVYAAVTPVEKEVVTARDVYRTCEVAM